MQREPPGGDAVGHEGIGREVAQAGQQRGLLRPVYWLGNWQFACLGYYEPPRRTADCAVRAEPFPPALAAMVREIERRVRAQFPRRDVPAEDLVHALLEDGIAVAPLPFRPARKLN